MILGPRSRFPSDNIQALGMTTMTPQPQFIQELPVRAGGGPRFEVDGHALAHRSKQHGQVTSGGKLKIKSNKQVKHEFSHPKEFLEPASKGGTLREFTFGTPSLTHEASSRPYRTYGGPRHGGVMMGSGVRLAPGPRSRSIAGEGLYA